MIGEFHAALTQCWWREW